MRTIDRIDHWDDERDIGNSLIVTLKAGWAFNAREREHVRGFDNARQAKSAVRLSERCDCPECARAALSPTPKTKK